MKEIKSINKKLGEGIAPQYAVFVWSCRHSGLMIFSATILSSLSTLPYFALLEEHLRSNAYKDTVARHQELTHEMINTFALRCMKPHSCRFGTTETQHPLQSQLI
jgi:hypothetical protein